MKVSSLTLLAICVLLGCATAAGQCMRVVEKQVWKGLTPGSFGPLQGTLTLDCLKFKGVATKGKELIAILEDEKGKSYKVLRGDLVGESNGEVTEVTPCRLTITQTVPDGIGGWLEQKRYITRFCKAHSN
jgi:hypothetical protein